MRGYEAVREAYLRAGQAATGTRGRHSTSLRLTRFAAVKFGTAVGVLSLAGVAAAGEANVLPAPIQRVMHTVLGPIGVPGPAPGIGSATPSPTGTSREASSQNPTSGATSPGHGVVPPGTSKDGTPSTGPDGTQSPTGDVISLCRLYGQDGGQGKDLGKDDLHRLTTLAGGKNKIADYCAGILGSFATSPGSTPPDSGSRGSSGPSQTPPTSVDPSKTHPTHPTSPDPTNGHNHTSGPTH
jgi:hypothetical protein